jgi:thiol:disulfide interchange protein
MKTSLLPVWLQFCFCLLLAVSAARVRAADAHMTNAPALYDESADGSKQIADALETAQKENKHVLLDFGANWATWCYKLHQLCQTNQAIATKLKSDYVVVLVDVNKKHNQDIDTRYGHPTHFGLPVLVVLDADGRQLCTQDAAKLEEGNHHNPIKVLTFLTAYGVKN